MYDRKAYKLKAKELIRTSVPHFMLVTLVYVLLTTGLSTAVTELSTLGTLGGGVLSMFLSILVSLFSMVVSMGFSYYALRLSRGQTTGMGSLFQAFSFAGRSIGMNILVAVYTFLWSLGLVVAFSVIVALLTVALQEVMVLYVILMVVFYIALMVGVFAIVLRYSMASFALVDDPEAGASAAIHRSVRMMRGYKKKYFVMMLSFIGWELLIALIAMVVLGIGALVTGMEWVVDAFAGMGDDPMQVYTVMGAAMGQLSIWAILAEVVCLPLTLWLLPYQQVSFALFYNHVGGYDYYVHTKAQEEAQERERAAAIPLADRMAERNEAEPPAPTPAGGYYTPVTPETPAEEPTVQESAEEAESSDGEEEI